MTSLEEKKIPAVSFVGRSGSGKTTFLEHLIPVLAKRGYRVGALKHAHHMVEMDKSGKDSYRLREAGASEVVASAPNLMALIRPVQEELPLPEALGYFQNVDVVLVEGYRGKELPKIEIFRESAGGEDPLFTEDSSLLALITDRSLPNLSKPLFALDDHQGVADLIIRQLIENSLSSS